MPMKTTIKVGGKSLEIFRLTLRGWSKLDTIRRQMEEDVSKRDFASTFNSIVRFIETSSTPVLAWDKLPWYEFIEVYSKVNEISAPTISFPILEISKKEGKEMPWEYKGRAWFYWLNLFADHYGWSEEVIGELDIDTALGLYQEIETEGQLHREWEWGLSQNSISYNKNTRNSEFKPLPRPEWMLATALKELPTIRMRKDMIPAGIIVDLSVKNGS